MARVVRSDSRLAIRRAHRDCLDRPAGRHAASPHVHGSRRQTASACRPTRSFDGRHSRSQTRLTRYFLRRCARREHGRLRAGCHLRVYDTPPTVFGASRTRVAHRRAPSQMRFFSPRATLAHVRDALCSAFFLTSRVRRGHRSVTLADCSAAFKRRGRLATSGLTRTGLNLHRNRRPTAVRTRRDRQS